MHIAQFLSLLFILNAVQAQQLVSKPFIGHKSSTELHGWCMFKNADSVSLRCWSIKDSNQYRQTIYFDKKQAFRKYLPVSFTFDQLQPNCDYHIESTTDGGNTYIRLFDTRTVNDSLEDFSFLAGSCAFIGTGFNGILKPGNDLRILYNMRRDSADLMIWLGDNLYYLLQAHTYKKHLKRNVKTRLNLELAAFLASKQNYAIWDDHDYGTNNSDGSFKHKAGSLDVFRQFWPNPRDTQAVANYYTFSREDAQFFMLDDRYENEAESVVLGSAQLDWLKTELSRSTATFKFICIGMQALNPRSTMECLSKTKTEYRELVDHILDNRIGGVLFLSGDRHHAELLKVEEPGLYPLYDFTTSPISMYPVRISEKSPEYANPYRVPGTYFPDYNYAKVSIRGPAGQRICTLQLFDRYGRLVWEFSPDKLTFD